MDLKNNNILQHVINGVAIEILNYRQDYVGIQFAKTTGYYYLGERLHITYEGGSTGKCLADCRLLLHPMNKLSNESLRFDMESIDHFSHIDWTTTERDDWIKKYGQKNGLMIFHTL